MGPPWAVTMRGAGALVVRVVDGKMATGDWPDPMDSMYR